MNNIAFSSNIKLCSITDYTKEISNVYSKDGCSVKWPWTANEIVKAPKAFTLNVMDCSAGGITDGKDVVLFHICPTMSENNDFSLIEKAIKNRLNSCNKNLQGFLLGSDFHFKDSINLMIKFQRMMEKLHIPTSIIAKSDQEGVDIAYNTTKDEWSISSYTIDRCLRMNEKDPLKIIKRVFKTVNIHPQDSLSL